MHKRNIALTTLAWALLISLLVTLFPGLTHFDTLGLFYFPAIFLSIVFSGGAHSPSLFAGWSSFLVYTLFYWALLLIGYVLLLEFMLLRQVLHHVESCAQQLCSATPDSKLALEKLGLALAEVETKRRKHFLLQNLDLPDLGVSPHLLAARALSTLAGVRPVTGLMKHLRKQLGKNVGAEQAAEIIAQLIKSTESYQTHKPG
jgi:hypothetical protein